MVNILQGFQAVNALMEEETNYLDEGTEFPRSVADRPQLRCAAGEGVPREPNKSPQEPKPL